MFIVITNVYSKVCIKAPSSTKHTKMCIVYIILNKFVLLLFFILGPAVIKPADIKHFHKQSQNIPPAVEKRKQNN